MDYKQAFHEEYLRQQHNYDMGSTCGVDHESVYLLDETPTFWILKVDADGRICYVCVVWKQNAAGYIPRPMVIVEL
jgi:hypothetical protein